MHSADILALVRKSRWRFLSKIAAESGVSEASLNAALRRPQRRAELAIAKALGKTPHQLWPHRWDRDGNRITYRGYANARRAA
jgi:Ner family transcriptional regulator